MTSNTPTPLHGINIYVDNRIKYGTLLPTKDKRNYRCSKETLELLKREIDKQNSDSYLKDSILFKGIYKPFVLPPRYGGIL